MCRSGCKTQDHQTWGECARAAHLRVGWLESGLDATAEKNLQSELALYRQARADGLQPNQSTTASVRDAYRVSEMTGKPYNGEKDIASGLVPSKNIAKGAMEVGLL